MDNNIIEQDLIIRPLLTQNQEFYKISQNEKKTIIGRSQDSLISIKDPFVSKKHAEITYEGNCFFIQDISTFGSFIKIQDSKNLCVDDTIRLGISEYCILIKAIKEDQKSFVIIIELQGIYNDDQDRNTTNQQIFEIQIFKDEQQKNISIGRQENSNIFISSQDVSRVHAEIQLVKGDSSESYHFKYVNISKNGSWVKIIKNQKYQIQNNQEYFFGSLMFQFEVKQQEKIQNSARDCVICMNNKVNTYFSQCGHAALCKQCCLEVLQTTHKCPICIRPIQDFHILH